MGPRRRQPGVTRVRPTRSLRDAECLLCFRSSGRRETGKSGQPSTPYQPESVSHRIHAHQFASRFRERCGLSCRADRFFARCLNKSNGRMSIKADLRSSADPMRISCRRMPSDFWFRTELIEPWRSPPKKQRLASSSLPTRADCMRGR